MADTDELTTLLQSISSTVIDLVSTTAGDVQDFGIPGSSYTLYDPDIYIDFITSTDGLSALTGLGETNFDGYMPDLTN